MHLENGQIKDRIEDVPFSLAYDHLFKSSLTLYSSKRYAVNTKSKLPRLKQHTSVIKDYDGVLFDVPETFVSTGLSWVASLSQSKELNFPLQMQPLRLSSSLC